jgi:hypothetical protein
MMIARLGASFGLVAIALASNAQETFDIATFELPPGWQRETQPGLLLLRSPAGDGQIVLLPSFASAASPADNFTAEWARLVTASLGAVPEPQLTTERSPDGWTAVIGATNVTRQGATSALLQVTATGFGRAMSVLAQLTSDARAGEVTQFFERFEFRAGSSSAAADVAPQRPGATTALPTNPVAAPPSAVRIAPAGFAGDRPTGLFYRVVVATVGGRTVELETRLFLDGNRIARVFPFGGAETFASARCSPDTCGTYELEARTLRVRWDGGRIDRWAYERTAEGLRLDGTPFRPARALTAAALVGEWSGGQSAGSAIANLYRFEPGGRFWFGSGTTGLRGRYRVEGLTLTLSFDDGDLRSRTLFAAGTSEPTGLIGVDGDVYARR